MADAVERALRESGTLLIEAGTGTGKSLAYLVPAAESAQRVVISTATKALGEQLVEKDIPTIRRLGLHPDVTLVKGLSNYVCKRRLEEYRQSIVTGAVAPEHGIDRILDWVERTETGDRSDLPSLPEDAPVWREVTSSSDTRIGAKCRFYEECFVTKMRRSAEASQIIVTNHHLFCADLALRNGFSGAQALPDYDAIIFDEAHALEDVATEFFGVRLTRTRVDTLVRDADRALRAAGFFVDRSREQSVLRTLMQLSSGRAAALLLHPPQHRPAAAPGLHAPRRVRRRRPAAHGRPRRAPRPRARLRRIERPAPLGLPPRGHPQGVPPDHPR